VSSSQPRFTEPDQRLDQTWQPLLALALVELLEGLLSDALSLRTLAPSNELAETISLVLTAVLFFSSLLAWLFASSKTARTLTMIFAGWVTAGLIYSVFALLLTMPARARSGTAFTMLADAVLVWVVNILIFAVWYWLVDSGGVTERQRTDYLPHDLVFPQQMNPLPGWGGWKPGFFDYVFLAFNTSTAFSPTDTFILSKRVKALTMLQAAISLISLATLAAYAVNLMAR
jgi:hypothetical protein